MVSNIIKKIMDSKGIGNQQMAEALGIKTQSFNNKLYRDSYTVRELVKILDILDCKLIIEPNPEINYIVTRE